MENGVQVTIRNEQFLIKKSNRALIMFEEMTKKSVYEMQGFGDLLKSFYCILKANNRTTFLYDFDTFLDILDEDDVPVEVFNEYLQSQAEGLEPETKDVIKKKVVKPLKSKKSAPTSLQKV